MQDKCVTFLQQFGVSFLHQTNDDVVDARQVVVALLTLQCCFKSSRQILTAGMPPHTHTEREREERTS